MQQNSRRTFLKKISLASLATTCLSPQDVEAISPATEVNLKEDHLIFLFQGDSITDGNRGRNNDPNHIMGHGYAFSIASRVGADFPAKHLSFYNRGISGNKITDLEARWQKDVLDLNPDVLSILVGVNDVDSVIRQKNVVSAEKFEELYRLVLTRTKTQLPGCLLVLCEPFILPVGRVKDNWNEWENEMKRLQNITARLSNEYNAVFVPLQATFNKAAERVEREYWIWDGIHPTVAGHELIAREWLRQVAKQLRFLKKY